MKSRGHGDAMAELYRKDPALALEVINGILEDGDQKAASSPAPSMQACKYIAMSSSILRYSAVYHLRSLMVLMMLSLYSCRTKFSATLLLNLPRFHVQLLMLR